MDEGNRPKFQANKPYVKRVHLLLTEEQLDAVDEWMEVMGHENRNEAIRQLIFLGMQR